MNRIGLALRKIQLPQISERIRVISLPKNGVMFLCDNDDVYKIKVEDNAQPIILNEDPFIFPDSFETAIGLTNQKPILEYNGNSLNYDFDPIYESVFIECKIAKKIFDIEFPTLSGDWFAASFSECGKYILFAEPYSFDLYEI